MNASSNHLTDEDSDGFIGWDHDQRKKSHSYEDQESHHGTASTTLNNNHVSSAMMSRNSSNQEGEIIDHHDETTPQSPTNANDDDDNNNHATIDMYPSPSSEEFENDSTSTDGRWSLSVRLTSAVDLPSSIIPSMPLCPLMKFGLITVTEENEIEDLEKSSAKSRRAEFEQLSSVDVLSNAQNHHDAMSDIDELSRSNLNKSSIDPSNCSKQESLRIITSSGRRGILSQFQQRDSLEECIAKSQSKTKLQFTSGKIMSKKDNGMMEWNEEMRWDDIEMPLQAVLCVELSARAVFPPSIMSAMETLSDFEHMSFDVNNNHNSTYGSANNSNHSKDDGQYTTNTPGSKGGLLGFWRKSRSTNTNTNNRKQRRGIGGGGGGGGSNMGSLTNSPSYHGSDDSGMDYNDETTQKEMEKATAAAAVARYLMESQSEKEEEKINEETNDDTSNVEKQVKTSIQDGDIRLGTLLIPICNLPLEDEVPTVEKWFQFDSVTEGSKNYDNETSPSSKGPSFRSPSALLQISLSNPDILDELEEDVYTALNGDGEAQEDGTGGGGAVDLKPSLQSFRDHRPHSVDSSFRSRKGSADMDQLRKEEKIKLEEAAKIQENGPYLKPGLIDHICVVGPQGAGGARIDLSTKGWIEPQQESCILEQFPPEGFHYANGRQVSLPHKVEWWCFPEGCRLWCGSEPPTHMDMNLKRFSASSPKTMASSIAAFDACLDCTSSFMWWVMSSNSDEYGSAAKKTYGAVIRFYAPVPNDPYSQKKYSRFPVESDNTANEAQQLWSPVGICITSSLPIVGIMEALLLRLCERLSSSVCTTNIVDKVFHQDMMDLVLNFQSPIPGVINCSIPFLAGDVDRLLISLPPKDGLPPLPHGASVASVCRLLGADGLNALLASVLTESKILIHSADVANLAMVAEVITALIYPFEFQLPYVPVIPLSLMEVLEAPVSYFVGVPSCNMKYIDKSILTDVVVIDLDNGFSTPDYFDGRRGVPSSRTTIPLPALVSSNISKAVFRLLRDEEEVEEQFGASNFSETRHLPRLDGESLAERNFRIAVAQQICSLIRGYQECLFFVSVNQPVFNRDRFLRQAPALFEERPIPVISLDDKTIGSPSQRILSPRSKRFLSGLVNTQHFHDLLERLDDVATTFFHQIMDSFQQDSQEQADSNQIHIYGTEQQNELTTKLGKNLDIIENQIPVYHVHRRNAVNDDAEFQGQNDICITSFTSVLLKAVKPSGQQESNANKNHSLQQLLEIQESPWQYSKIFDIDLSAFGDNATSAKDNSKNMKWPKIQLREAMGERKFRIWKEQQDDKEDGSFETTNGKDSTNNHDKSMLDLLKLLPLENENSNGFPIRTNRNGVKSVDERDVIRQYIEKAYEVANMNEAEESTKFLNGSDFNIEKAMCKATAQRFFVSILSQRARLQNERPQDFNNDGSISQIQPIVFECLVRLCNAMLDACIRDFDYESAHRLLTHSTGFCTVMSDPTTNGQKTPSTGNAQKSFLTKRISVHVIFKDMRLWDRVLLIHKQDRQKDRSSVIERSMHSEVLENDEYEATVTTLYEMIGYGMPSDELAKFASRIATDKLFSTDSEQKVLMLARKLALKCNDADSERDSMLFGRGLANDAERSSMDDNVGVGEEFHVETKWEEISWSHPASTIPLDDSNVIGSGEGYAGKSPVTALASFGSSVVASGALDGSIFVANTFNLADYDSWNSFDSRKTNVSGVRLEWQRNSYGSLSNNSVESNVGAISCLATSKGFNHLSRRNAFDFDSNSSSDAILNAVAGCRIIGGTTRGDVRMWSLQDILVNHLAADTEDTSSMLSDTFSSTHSSHIRSASQQDANQWIEARAGFSLGNHRGGVTCLSVPAQTYRPDSLISGGNDGLIKLWSLRQSHKVSKRGSMGGRTSRMLFSGRESTSRKASRGTVDVLAGHGGRVLCLETAWHGDRLLSGAADLTLKLWDLSKGGSNCIQTMHGHTGWVTHACFWGRNTAISASTDRSIALWDSRTGNVPLFALRHHKSPISDLYIESRNSYWMSSAGSEGVVATWDCRKLSSAKDTMSIASQTTETVREPRARMKHCQILQNGAECVGPVMLAKGVNSRYGQGDRTIMSVSTNGCINEWDVMNGRLLFEHNTTHCNAISCFKTFRDHENLFKGRRGSMGNNLCILGGTITAAWDGRIKVRRMLLNKSNHSS